MGNGCPKELNQTITSKPQVAAVRCCNINDCVTPKGPNECFKVTFDQAEEKCAEIGVKQAKNLARKTANYQEFQNALFSFRFLKKSTRNHGTTRFSRIFDFAVCV